MPWRMKIILAGLAVFLYSTLSAQSLRIRVRLEEKVELNVIEVVLTSDLDKPQATGSKEEISLKEFHYDKIDPLNFTVHYPKIPKVKSGQYSVLMKYRIGEAGPEQTRKWTITAVHGKHIYTEARFAKQELGAR
jgi:hypothetical protein